MEAEWVNKAIEEATRLFSKWGAGKAKVWDYTPTHSKLTLRVESECIPGNLHIVCGGCSYFRGPFAWRDCEFQVNRQVGEDGGVILMDKRANFELHCRIVSGEENVEPVYTANLGAPPAEE
jgi:hypothetical protein